MNYRIKDYSQWFPGKENQVTDALSQDDDRSDEELTKILYSTVPSQIPSHFEIVPLPNRISSWLTSLLLRLPEKEQLQERHTRIKLGRGKGGTNGQNMSELLPTSTSSTSQNTKESSSLELSPWLCVKDVFQDKLMINWLQAQSKVPSRMWLRPSGREGDQTQQKTKMESLADFYRASTGHSRTMTPHQSNKRPYQPAC